MQNVKIRNIAITVAIVAAGFVAWTIGRRYIPSHMEYQGQQIKLSKFYLSYEDYKDDPDNIDQSENEHVFRLMSQAPIAHFFADRKEAIHALFEIKFPGYGAGPVGEFQQPDGKVLYVFGVEIPRADKERYFTFLVEKGTYTLLDSFVPDTVCWVESAQLQSGKILYKLRDGKGTLTRPVLSENNR